MLITFVRIEIKIIFFNYLCMRCFQFTFFNVEVKYHDIKGVMLLSKLIQGGDGGKKIKTIYILFCLDNDSMIKIYINCLVCLKLFQL